MANVVPIPSRKVVHSTHHELLAGSPNRGFEDPSPEPRMSSGIILHTRGIIGPFDVPLRHKGHASGISFAPGIIDIVDQPGLVVGSDCAIVATAVESLPKSEISSSEPDPRANISKQLVRIFINKELLGAEGEKEHNEEN